MKSFKLSLGFCLIALAAIGCAQQTTRSKVAGLQRIHFDFDQSVIKTEYEPVLQGNAAYLKSHSGLNITIEGHCDERGTNEYNIALGDRRAKAAKRYLVNLGIGDNRMSTVSYGEERPLCTQHEESCWWQNRRAEFLK